MTDYNNQQIKTQITKLYPELFNDDTAKDKLDPLITQADMYLHQYKSNISSSQYHQLIQLMTAHLLYQSEDDDVSSVSIADVHFQFNSNQNKSGSGNGNGNGDKYLSQLISLLHALLGDNGWSVQFD